jgi:hypothetical protein
MRGGAEGSDGTAGSARPSRARAAIPRRLTHESVGSGPGARGGSGRRAPGPGPTRSSSRDARRARQRRAACPCQIAERIGARRSGCTMRWRRPGSSWTASRPTSWARAAGRCSTRSFAARPTRSRLPSLQEASCGRRSRCCARHCSHFQPLHAVSIGAILQTRPLVKHAQLLCSIPGVQKRTAEILVAEISEPGENGKNGRSDRASSEPPWTGARFVNEASEESVRVLALAAQRHRARGSYGSAAVVGLEVLKPGFDCRFAETSIPAESDMRYPARSSLRPDPVGLHAEKLSNLISGQQFVHDRFLPTASCGAAGRIPRSDRLQQACAKAGRRTASAAWVLDLVALLLVTEPRKLRSPGRYRAGRRMGRDVDGNLKVGRRE